MLDKHNDLKTTYFKHSEIARSVRSVLIGSSAAVALSVSGTALAADYQSKPLPEHVVSTPTTFKIPQSNTSVTVGGYVKGDVILDLDADVGDSFSVAAIPNDEDQDIDSNVRMHARQSRLIIGSETDVGGGDTIRTHVEGDFFGPQGTESFSNSDSFRIRHAYADYATDAGTLKVGKNWTLFGGFNYVPTVDFFAPNGQIFIRQAQVRWTFPSGFAVSIENPETFFGFGQVADSTDELPDVVVKWSGGPGGSAGNYEVSAVLRQVGGVGTGIDGNAFDDEESVVGVHLGGTWAADAVTFTAGLAFGEGLGRYHLANTSGGVVGVDGEIETLDQIGLTAGVSFATTATSSININLGHSQRDDDFDNLTPTADEEGTSIHANYMFSPWPDTNFGFEVMHGIREAYNGDEGEATRLQFGAFRFF